MKCPLFMAAVFTHQKLYGKDEADCLKEKCAWWSKPHELCDVNILAQELYKLSVYLEDIREKLLSKERLV